MIIRQLSVLVEDKPGAIVDVLAFLKDKGINLRASSLADTGEFGIFRMVVNDPDMVEGLLRQAGFTIKATQVLALALNDDPGCLHENLRQLSEACINVEYSYGFAAVKSNGGARVILKVDDLERAVQILNERQIYSEENDIPEYYW